MRLVALIASQPGRMISGYNLRKPFWLGRIGLMAADAELGRIELFWSSSAGISSVRGQRPMACLAIYPHVLAFDFLIENVRMAGFTSFMPRIVDRLGLHVSQCITAEVAVLAKAPGYQKAAQRHK